MNTLFVRSLAALALIAVTLTASTRSACAAERYEVVHGWPELPPGEILGQTTGVDVDSKGNVWVFHRAGREWSEPFPRETIGLPTVWVFDGSTGRLLKSWKDGAVYVVDAWGQRVQKFVPR